MTTIGKISVLGIFDGTGKEPAREVLSKPGQLDPWECHSDLLDPQGNLEFALGGFLVLAGDRKILIDTGVGTISNDKYEGGLFLENLRGQGIAPEEITDVVFTHLHFDHVGWATQKGKVVFDNATYRVHSADWKYFVESPEANPGAIRKLQPLTDHLETFDEDRELVPGLSSRHVAGHTPGSTIFTVSSGSDRAIFLGDVVHSVVELTEEGWEAVFDVDPVGAKAVRSMISDELAASGELAAAAHFPQFQLGRIVTSDGLRKWKLN
ncbi:MAG: MBL fold metallo-hydrolase [Acidimicrobiaceae bacterium]|nr:MBL fold metallo-hydrolase [Acidimicrobiaceae bacterium]